MALFDPTPASCLFAANGSQSIPTQVSLVFERPTRSQNSIGEVALSFASALTALVDLQPTGGGFWRMAQGQLETNNYTGVIQGYALVEVGDRASVYSALLEITNVGRFGTLQTEIGLKVVR